MINVPQLDESHWPCTAEELYQDKISEFYTLRNTAYYNLLEQEFQLQYHAHISIEYQDTASVHERRTFLELLHKQKSAEAEAINEAKAKNK